MRTELLQPGPALALGALLDVPVPDLERDGLPLLWHWVYLLDHPAQADLGADGHPVRDTVAATPGRGRRRMWAGGRIRTAGALRCGEEATRRSTILSTKDKEGRSGKLTFVVVRNEVLQRGEVVVDEEQDIVYRDAGTTPLRVDEGAEVGAAGDEWSIDVSPTLLFRFSALTYNAHRIHYDRDYARDVEGYPGLVTHGPLQALAMAEAARARGCAGDQHFDYRLISPLFAHQGLIAKAEKTSEATTTSVRDRYGRVTATGQLR
ncbi:MaoC family dehydratase N-terminal domain-containing protein [Lentzea sp. HUAS12]|uniref:FAS1-like dehydratase domain-containing protein n=1 Tax=Lentzea sp. HUAS12 TaxID=2951806 RepID=UPI00209FB4F2|nr:MaoC family dehydratase N-terminal domain-containing protein [Lentzea sp. HUAS12]USX53945.1 MaoC family dehydratase N-terminal domain-containing protein [Lentzea sp. HUAS12]